ncbi:hypothetical protein ES703_39764 [subsurface metagenome]
MAATSFGGRHLSDSPGSVELICDSPATRIGDAGEDTRWIIGILGCEGHIINGLLFLDEITLGIVAIGIGAALIAPAREPAFSICAFIVAKGNILLTIARLNLSEAIEGIVGVGDGAGILFCSQVTGRVVGIGGGTGVRGGGGNKPSNIVIGVRGGVVFGIGYRNQVTLAVVRIAGNDIAWLHYGCEAIEDIICVSGFPSGRIGDRCDVTARIVSIFSKGIIWVDDPPELSRCRLSLVAVPPPVVPFIRLIEVAHLGSVSLLVIAVGNVVSQRVFNPDEPSVCVIIREGMGDPIGSGDATELSCRSVGIGRSGSVGLSGYGGDPAPAIIGVGGTVAVGIRHPSHLTGGVVMRVNGGANQRPRLCQQISCTGIVGESHHILIA